MPKSTTRTPSGKDWPARRFATSTPKASSPRKIFPIPAIRIAFPLDHVGRQRCHFFRRKKEAMPGLFLQAQIAVRIAVDYHSQLKLALIVLLDRLDGRDHAGKSHVEDVASLAGTQAHAIAWLHLHASDVQAFRRRFVFEKLPLPFVHGIASPRPAFSRPAQTEVCATGRAARHEVSATVLPAMTRFARESAGRAHPIRAFRASLHPSTLECATTGFHRSRCRRKDHRREQRLDWSAGAGIERDDSVFRRTLASYSFARGGARTLDGQGAVATRHRSRQTCREDRWTSEDAFRVRSCAFVAKCFSRFRGPRSRVEERASALWAFYTA